MYVFCTVGFHCAKKLVVGWITHAMIIINLTNVSDSLLRTSPKCCRSQLPAPTPGGKRRR